jgi:steroid delta-isomerase-like uncharacterized protein
MSSRNASEAANKALLRRWFEEVWNGGRADLIDRLRAPAAIATGLGEGNAAVLGDAPFKTFYSNVRETFPDLNVTVEDMVAEDDKVVARISVQGTHTGTALGPAPTGRRVSFGAIVMARIADGKIVEAWNSLDQLAMLKQIGAIPPGAVRDNFLFTRP